MDLKNLNTFLHVAELNSFTKAGAALGYSQSTVSFQIRQLETELGFPLFERIGHTVVLTEKGRDVLSYAHEVNRLTAQFHNTMKQDTALSGHIRLATSDSLCHSLMGAHFSAFHRRYPHLTLQILTAGTREMFRLAAHNEVDAILTLDSHVYDTDYVIVREQEEAAHFVVSAQSPFARQEQVSITDLLDQPFLLTEKGMSYRRLLDEGLAQRSLELRPVAEMSDAALIAQLVAQGDGISFLPDFVTRSAVEQGQLKTLHVPGFDLVLWKQLIHHRAKWISPQLDSVLRFCVEHEFPAHCEQKRTD